MYLKKSPHKADPPREEKKQGKLGTTAGAPRDLPSPAVAELREGGSAILVYAQARETCRRPKIAVAFFEPNSPHC